MRRRKNYRAEREAAMTEWSGLLELRRGLDEERQALITVLRDRWLSGGLDALVSSVRDLAQQLRQLDTVR